MACPTDCAASLQGGPAAAMFVFAFYFHHFQAVRPLAATHCRLFVRRQHPHTHTRSGIHTIGSSVVVVVVEADAGAVIVVVSSLPSRSPARPSCPCVAKHARRNRPFLNRSAVIPRVHSHSIGYWFVFFQESSVSASSSTDGALNLSQQSTNRMLLDKSADERLHVRICWRFLLRTMRRVGCRATPPLSVASRRRSA